MESEITWKHDHILIPEQIPNNISTLEASKQYFFIFKECQRSFFLFLKAEITLKSTSTPVLRWNCDNNEKNYCLQVSKNIFVTTLDVLFIWTNGHFYNLRYDIRRVLFTRTD